MRHLAIAGTILLASLLGSAPAAEAHAHGRSHGIHHRVRHTHHTYHHTYHRAHRVHHARGSLGVRSAARSNAMANVVLSAARRHGVPAQLALGVARVESGFNPRARSRSGAVGLMQILPSTARGLGCRGSLSSPAANADCGARYLAEILGDHRGDVRVAAAMYTQGRYARRMSRVGARYAALVLRHGKRVPA